VRGAVSLIADDDGVHGVILKKAGKTVEVKSRSVVLAAGGFQGEHRVAHALPGSRLGARQGARARAFNTGDAIRMALDIGRAAGRHWSGCHAVAWERNAPEFGDLAVGDQVPEALLSLGHLPQCGGQALRRRGRRLPQLHLRQVRARGSSAAGQFAWQIFDGKVKHLLRRRVQDSAGDKTRSHTLPNWFLFLMT